MSSSTPPIAFETARLLAARGQAAQASEILDRLLEREPAHVSALLLKGQLRLDARDGEDALSFYERARLAAPESAEAGNGLARCLHALGRDEAALVAAQQARSLLGVGDNFRHAASVYLTLVWCLREMRQYQQALDLASEGLERCPDAILAQWATLVEEELAEAQKEEC
jgi:tetratricopeptide (TPR) repeat protein